MDALGLCAELTSVVLMVQGTIMIHRGVTEHTRRLELGGKVLTVLSAVFTSVALYLLPESIVGPLGLLTIPGTYAAKRNTKRREWFFVIMIMAGAISMTISKPPSRKPNPLNERVLWCILIGCFTTLTFMQFQSRPVFAGFVGALTSTCAKAALTSVNYPVKRIEMTTTYGICAIVFGFIQLDFVSRAYVRFTEKQVIPMYLVSMVFFEVALANWVFQELDNWSVGFVGGFVLASGSAMVV